MVTARRGWAPRLVANEREPARPATRTMALNRFMASSTLGALVEVQLPGGEGYGPPTERDAELIALDRLEGYAS